MSGSERRVCIHGHFYQPPRENPWIDEIEVQDSAHPYHDWNERITAECYTPNTEARILDEAGRIVRIVNNYRSMSFNFGPTLLRWLEIRHPETYASILDADRESVALHGGHGSALAQVYNHPILPLCNERDRRTQVLWGIRDFEHRFGRPPDGMWLPETAVDLASLDELARHGIRFTILASSQARAVRPSDGSRGWLRRSGDSLDTTRPYRVRLRSGREIAVFFYDGPVSRGVAFEGLLLDGGSFARRLVGAFRDDAEGPRLVHIATDGETYGHHHTHGEMALAFALDAIQSGSEASLTNYGQFLELCPPRDDVRIHQNSSWSCAHGVERWQSDCGCASEIRGGWHQRWREPLRVALDWLRDTLVPVYTKQAGDVLTDPWAARDDYIDLILDRSAKTRREFFERHQSRPLDDAEQTRALKLLELQRHAMLMYTSCGWFFEEVSRIETLQILQYAARVIELAGETLDADVESGFLERLEGAPSNVPEHGDARRLYESCVKPARVDLPQIGANRAAALLFNDGDGKSPAGHRIEIVTRHTLSAAASRLVLGHLRVSSRVTLERADLAFGFVHFGDYELNGGVRAFPGDDAFRAMVDDVETRFASSDRGESLRTLEHHLGRLSYSLTDLLVDERRRILGTILQTTLRDAEDAYRKLYGLHAPLLRWLRALESPPPREMRLAAELVVNAGLERELRRPDFDVEKIRYWIAESRESGVLLDESRLQLVARESLERLAMRWFAAPEDRANLDRLRVLAEVVRTLPFEIGLANVQNACYRVLLTTYGEAVPGAEDTETASWLESFRRLADILGLAV